MELRKEVCCCTKYIFGEKSTFFDPKKFIMTQFSDCQLDGQSPTKYPKNKYEK